MAGSTALRGALVDAIYREIDARDFYGAISLKIENPGGKERFKRLSEDEDGHRVTLESWFGRLFSEDFSLEEGRLIRSYDAGLDLNTHSGALAALDMAIEAEENANDFYREQAGLAEDGELKKMFLALAEMELGHYNLLQAEKNFLIGGFYWYDMDSTPFMED